MRASLLLFLILRVTGTFAQTVTVRDAVTGNPIPYASVFFITDSKISGGISCNEAGVAKLPAAVYSQIKVSCIGYQDNVLLKTDIGSELFLRPEEIKLPGVVIGDSSISVNYYNGDNGLPMALGRDSEQVVYFRNPVGKPAALSAFSVDFFTTKSGCTARLLMYAVPDTLHHDKPGKNLLPHDILLTLEPGPEGRKIFDLSGYGLILPAGGAYIGLEEVKNTGDVVRYKTVISNDPVYLYWQKYLGLPWYNLNRLLVVLYHKDYQKRRDRKDFRVPSWGIKLQTD
mgnify:CR=1 FL=1